MFKKFRKSVYWKGGAALVASGAILIVFNNWIKNFHFTLGLDKINDTLGPMYIGLILTFLICPVYNYIVREAYDVIIDQDVNNNRYIDPAERRRVLAIAKTIASTICFLLVVGVMALLIYAIVPQVVTSCVDLGSNLPDRLATLSDWLSVHFSRFPELAKWVDDLAHTGTTEIFKWIQANVIEGDFASLAAAISASVVTAVNYVVDLFIGILIMIYLLNYKEKLLAIGRKLIAASCKQKTQDGLYEFYDIVNETFIGFIVGRIIDSVIIGVLTYVILLVCGISFAPMISVIVGVTNVIPFFGPFIGAVPSVMILMLENPVQALYFLIIILLVQQLDGNVIGPKIVGNAIGIDSFWVLVAVLVGGGLFGFAGMACGVPVFAVMYRYANKITSKRLVSKGKDAKTSDYMSLEVYRIDSSRIDLDKKSPEKVFLKKFTRTAPVIEDEEAEQEREATQAFADSEEELDEIKEQLAKDLLGLHLVGEATNIFNISHKAVDATDDVPANQTEAASSDDEEEK